MKRQAPFFFFNHTVLNARRNKSKRIKLLTSIIDKGEFFNGRETKKLEKKLLEFIGTGFLTTTASGHDAINIALKSLNLKESDEVILPTNSYPTAFATNGEKFKIIFCDVNNSGQVSWNEIKDKITTKTKAVIVVHMYGNCSNIEKIASNLKKRKITLIEDCAQSFGSSYRNRSLGTFGDISCFSFYPTKNLGTLGDGGAIWTRNKKSHKFFLMAKSYGEEERYKSEFISGHSRIPEIQAGILNLYLVNIKKDFQKRKKIFKYYTSQILNLGLDKYLRILDSDSNSDPVNHLLVVEVKERDRLMKFLEKKNIKTYIHYPLPLHLVPAFSFLKYKLGDFPIAERLSKNILSLPFHPSLTKESVDYITKEIRAFYEQV